MYRRREKKGPVSVLQGDEKFLEKILSRTSSVGRSNRISTYRSSGQVPFKWEMKPGMPRSPSQGEIFSDFDGVEEVVIVEETADQPIQPPPPPSPVQSSSSGKRSFDRAKQAISISLTKSSSFWRKMTWKKTVKKMKMKKIIKKRKADHQGCVDDHDHAFDNSVEFSNSDIDFRASVSESSSSSSSSSSVSSLHRSGGNVQYSSALKRYVRRFVKRFVAKPLLLRA